MYRIWVKPVDQNDPALKNSSCDSASLQKGHKRQDALKVLVIE
jgi:formyltetrahydrofolate synthetase